MFRKSYIKVYKCMKNSKFSNCFTNKMQKMQLFRKICILLQKIHVLQRAKRCEMLQDIVTNYKKYKKMQCLQHIYIQFCGTYAMSKPFTEQLMNVWLSCSFSSFRIECISTFFACFLACGLPLQELFIGSPCRSPLYQEFLIKARSILRIV